MRLALDMTACAIGTLKQIQEVLKRDGLPPHDIQDDDPIAIYHLGCHNPDTYNVTHFPESQKIRYRASGNTGWRYINYYIHEGHTKLEI